MEDVLEIYPLPYNPDYPVVCMDESCKQMIGEVREPIPCAPWYWSWRLMLKEKSFHFMVMKSS